MTRCCTGGPGPGRVRRGRRRPRASGGGGGPQGGDGSGRGVRRGDHALAAALPEEAAGALVEAAAVLERLGATADLGRCRRTLRGLGLGGSTGRGRRSYGSELSPREREVAELLARGATNREIAQALVLSQRTVEQHVAQVLRKLGVGRKDVGRALGGEI